MTRQPVLARRAEKLLGSAVVATAPVAGGDICTATKLRLSNGTTALMKTLSTPPDGFFAREALGLRRLGAVEGGARTPEVLAVDHEVLIVAWVEPGKNSLEAAASFGAELAVTHQTQLAAYGDDQDGFIGRLPLPNRTAPTWAEFYAVRRLLPYLKLARDRGAVTPAQAITIESVVSRLTRLIPEEGPALVHGDLWNGNVLWGQEGRVWVIDPASYAGHREVDLAMLAMFGLPHLPRVMEAYQDAHPLTAGWEDRAGLHQLFPMLVHACLFGGGYGARAAETAARYV